MDIHEYIRNRIDELRISRNLSDSKLSQELGFNKNYLSNIKNDKNIPSMQALLEFCNYFGITLSEFFANYPSEALNRGTPVQHRIVAELLNKTSGISDEAMEAFLSAIKKASKEEMETIVKLFQKTNHS